MAEDMYNEGKENCMKFDDETKQQDCMKDVEEARSNHI